MNEKKAMRRSANYSRINSQVPHPADESIQHRAEIGGKAMGAALSVMWALVMIAEVVA